MSQDSSGVARTSASAKLARGAGVSLLGKVAGRGVHVLGQIAMARLLGPAVFGLYGFGWNLLSVVGLFSALGLNNGVIQYGARFWRNDADRLRAVLLQSLGMALVSGAMAGGAVYLAAAWLEQAFQKPGLAPVLRHLAPAFVFYAGLFVAAAATRVSQRMKFSVYAQDLLQPASGLVMFLLLHALGIRLLGAVWATSLSFAVGLGLAIFYLRRLFPEAFGVGVRPPSLMGALLVYSLPTILAGIFSRLTVQMGRFMVAYFRSATEMGVYQAISQTAIIFAIIMGGFNSILIPMVADLFHRKEHERLAEICRASTKWGLYLSLPLFLLIVAMPRELLTALFDQRYAEGAATLVILTLAQMVNVATGTVGPLFIMTGNQNRWILFSGTAFAANVGFNIALIPRWGIAGAALATLVSISGLFISGAWWIRVRLGIWPYDRRYLKALLAAAAAAGALALLRLVPFSWPVLQVLAGAVVSFGVFFLVLRLLGLDPEDLDFIKRQRMPFGR